VSVPVERWEACGNVYLLIEREALGRPLTADDAIALCDGIDGLGADGVLELLPGAGPVDVAMVIRNPDGSTTEACGNGTRMVARWASERSGSPSVVVGSEAGPLHCAVSGDRVRAVLAQSRFDGPQYRPDETPFPHPHRFVSVGNPHVVIPVPDVDDFPLAYEGPALERHPWFPERTNVEIMVPVDAHRVRMRAWERGVGETMACGTGACAVAVAAIADGIAESPVTVELPGGELVVEVGEDGAVALTGPARHVETITLGADLRPGTAG
jgi:diaminopimelate epimerase